jgi:hypothetical protein
LFGDGWKPFVHAVEKVRRVFTDICFIAQVAQGEGWRDEIRWRDLHLVVLKYKRIKKEDSGEVNACNPRSPHCCGGANNIL